MAQNQHAVSGLSPTSLHQTAETGDGTMCQHHPCCPPPNGPDREAARVVAEHPEQGWSLLCNGVVLFEDTGELLPGGEVIPPHRPTDLYHRPAV